MVTLSQTIKAFTQWEFVKAHIVVAASGRA